MLHRWTNEWYNLLTIDQRNYVNEESTDNKIMRASILVC